MVYEAVDPRGETQRIEFIPKYVAGQMRRSGKAFRNYDLIRRKLNRHPAMLQVHNVHDRPTDYVLIYEYFCDVSLRDLLLQTRLSWTEVCRCFAPVVDLLKQAHRSGIAHRFFSPACILIQPGAPNEVRVRGFHGALLPDVSALTVSGRLDEYLGKFAAPEHGVVDANDPDAGALLDVYAVGCCITAALRGAYPDFGVPAYPSESIIPEPEALRVVEGLLATPARARRDAWEKLTRVLEKGDGAAASAPKRSP
jgi:serine/threonine protein kinase